MKQLKLEVGKTYRSRRGKEVKIVKRDSGPNYPYKGDNDECYAENGIFDCQLGDTPNDLIEEVTRTRYTFSIPDGVKKVTVEQVGNKIVVEMGPEEVAPKPGDILVNKWGECVYF